MNSQNPNNVFVFDMDNTLIKTNKANNLAYSEAISIVLGVKSGIDLGGRFTRNKLKTTFPDLTEAQFSEIVARKEKCFKSYIKETELNQNLFRLLKLLHQERYHTILLTNSHSGRAINLCNYYNLACDYHTLDYFCYLMEYSCLKTIANKHKTSIRKIIRQYKDGKTWSVPYETKTGTKRVRPVKIADCKRGEASDIIYQRKKFSWKTTIRQRLNARVCELCGCKEADLYEVHVIRNLNELGNSDWETVMKKKRRKTLVVCSKCHERIHRH